MFKVFEENGKVNFVDSNNVLVGFDTNQKCCELFDWELSAEESELSEYNFDPSYLEESEEADKTSNERVRSIAKFKLICEGKPEHYLTLHNSHNGYYSHKFEMRKDDLMYHVGSV